MNNLDLRGKMDLYIIYRYGYGKFGRSIKNEQELQDFINELLNSVKDDLENDYSGDYEILEIVNNLGYWLSIKS